MEDTISPVQQHSRQFELPDEPPHLRIGLFAPPLVEPFQPSLSLPYLGAQMRASGLSPVCHNLSSLFYVWLFRRVRIESMGRYRELSESIGVLRHPDQFFDPVRYHRALETLEGFAQEVAERDGLPYTLYPESKPSAVVASSDYRALVGAMEGTLLERFLQDYIGFTLRLEEYNVIAFSATNAFQLASSLFISRALKRAGVRAHIILGGHAVTLAGANLVADRELSGCIDSMVLQGGADVFSEVCRDLVAGRTRRIYSARETKTGLDDKGFPTNKPYELVLQRDIDDLYLSPSHIFSIYSALGCSYGACTFCGSNRENADYVPRQIAVMLDEMQSLKHRYGIVRFNICDNNFDPVRARYFCDELEYRGESVYWQCTTRVYNTLEPALLRRMRRNGCTLINVGLESANDRILRMMRKGYTVAHTEQMMLSMAEAGMPVHTYVICGFPTETEAESENTLAFLKQHIARCHSLYFQDYEAQLATKVFADALGTATEGYPATRMIERLLEDPSVSRDFVAHGNLLRRKGYPFIEDHNFLYLIREKAEHGDR
ncbi:MAG: radical SAM protein [Acidobacteriota bacterium]|nr:radical SAM protein [Acidobacteriota bacterium]MDQ5835244.1 radical SAM protein [Acidobacteriota bacterium]